MYIYILNIYKERDFLIVNTLSKFLNVDRIKSPILSYKYL